MNVCQALIEFVAPSPPPGPAHRYVVLIYEQPAQFNPTAAAFFNSINDTNINREGFSISDFATNTSLWGPIAGTFFLVGAADADAASTTITTSFSPPWPSEPTDSTPAPSPPSPSSSAPQELAAITTNVPSGAEKVTSWMSLLVITTLSVGLVLV